MVIKTEKVNMLSVREIEADDIPHLLDYWYKSSDAHLVSMGVDLAKMHKREDFEALLFKQLDTPLESKPAYCIIWLSDNIPVGHSNTNLIEFGKKAHMHLHMWRTDLRKKGLGLEFLKMTIPIFFEKLKLQELYCEPYALNIAPNKTLEKLGFEFLKTYRAIPGSINFEQDVNQWRLRVEQLWK